MKHNELTEQLMQLQALCNYEGTSAAIHDAIVGIICAAEQQAASIADLEQQIKSRVVCDGYPTFYISTDGMVCTHRMDELDIPVWCRSANDGIEAMSSILQLGNSVELLETPDLAAFADAMITAVWEASGFDGGDIQDYAVEYGLLKEVVATEPCGDNCACSEATSFPTTCYRKTYKQDPSK
jgi:hypothetical protein